MVAADLHSLSPQQLLLPLICISRFQSFPFVLNVNKQYFFRFGFCECYLRNVCWLNGNTTFQSLTCVHASLSWDLEVWHLSTMFSSSGEVWHSPPPKKKTGFLLLFFERLCDLKKRSLLTCHMNCITEKGPVS